MALKRVCAHAGCPAAIPFGERWCARHKEGALARLAERERERQRNAPISEFKREASRLYGTAAWQKMRLAQLQAEPLCRICSGAGRIVPATVVDHIRRHNNDVNRFFDAKNLQSLCKPCHDRKTVTHDAAARRADKNNSENWDFLNGQ